MLPDTHIKEQISLSHIKILSANAGFAFQEYNEDFGMDGSICEIKYKKERKAYRTTGFCLDFQLKATVNAIPKKGLFLYDLEVKNYIDLIEKNIGKERILILYILPRDRSQWVEIDAEKTILRKAAYWCSLKGFPEVKNKEKVRIKIPKKNLLTSEVLIELINKVKGGCVL